MTNVIVSNHGQSDRFAVIRRRWRVVAHSFDGRQHEVMSEFRLRWRAERLCRAMNAIPEDPFVTILKKHTVEKQLGMKVPILVTYRVERRPS